VRSHGSVPRLGWEDHRVPVKGLVDQPRLISMDEVASFPLNTVTVWFALATGDLHKLWSCLRVVRSCTIMCIWSMLISNVLTKKVAACAS
jgi:hypothetical protein